MSTFVTSYYIAYTLCLLRYAWLYRRLRLKTESRKLIRNLQVHLHARQQVNKTRILFLIRDEQFVRWTFIEANTVTYLYAPAGGSSRAQCNEVKNWYVHYFSVTFDQCCISYISVPRLDGISPDICFSSIKCVTEYVPPWFSHIWIEHIVRSQLDNNSARVTLNILLFEPGKTNLSPWNKCWSHEKSFWTSFIGGGYRSTFPHARNTVVVRYIFSAGARYYTYSTMHIADYPAGIIRYIYIVSCISSNIRMVNKYWFRGVGYKIQGRYSRKWPVTIEV